MIKHSVTSSTGTSLNFPDNTLYRQFQEELAALELETYRRIRSRYGVWASNQNKFVQAYDDLNQLDSTYMEDLHSVALARESVNGE